MKTGKTLETITHAENFVLLSEKQLSDTSKWNLEFLFQTVRYLSTFLPGYFHFGQLLLSCTVFIPKTKT